MSERDIFTTAREMTDHAARCAYLEEACGDDTGLKLRIEKLLNAHEQPDSMLDHPAVPPHDCDQDVTHLLGHECGSGTADEVPVGFLSAPTRPDSLGRIGHYEVLQVLGHGGFGIVFRAFDELLQRVVAVKVMAPQLAATSPARKRFLREARSSAQVRHENVVQIYEVAEQPLPYLAMEFIPGETLQQRLNRVGPLEVSETLRIGRQIAEGLAAAHATDLIHRDIKPGNVLLEGGHQKVKITDFGLARAVDDASISQSGIIAGTPMYMAPEQALGQTLDQRADLFSLGSVLYQMVSGRPPFRANTTLAALKRVAEDKPRAIREIIPETPQWLCDIVAKLLAKNPADRYQSAREVADVLADCEVQLKAHTKLKDFSRIPRSQPERSGRRKWAAAAILLLPVFGLVMTELAGVTHLLWRPPTQDLVRSTGDPTTNPLTNQAERPSEAWVQLFNGKDLTGWKTHPRNPGDWQVKDGAIVGQGKTSFLFSERSDLADFHLRVEAKINPTGDSGIFLRAPFDVRVGDQPDQPIPGAYEAQIGVRSDFLFHTGSLAISPGGCVKQAPLMAHRPDKWFVLEMIAEGNHIQTRVNGETTADYRDENRLYARGHLALQVWGLGNTHVQVRKIEIRELPSASVPTESEATDNPSFDAKEAQEASAKQLGIPVETTNSIGMKLRLIPPGKFMMGSSKEEIDYWLMRSGNDWVNEKLFSEGPQHEVELTQPFYMGQSDVTVGQFRHFVQATGYQMEAGAWHFGKFDADKNWLNPGFAQTDDHPVVCVSWIDAVGFCNWLSKQEGKKYRLPTEAEWEYGCRAGSKGRWSFGENEGELLNYARFHSNSEGRTWPVAGLKENAWGLYDMHGNVFAWCQDFYDANYYKTSPPKDPPGPDDGGDRVQRGGAWGFYSGGCRSAFRVRNDPRARCVDDGFRVVLVVSPPASVRTNSGTNEKPSFDAKEAQEASAKQLGVPVETANSIGMKLRFIPSGKFTMGSSKEEIGFWLNQTGDAGLKGRLPDENPQHEVEITQPFYVGQTEVTLGQFRQCVNATGYKLVPEREDGAFRGFSDGGFQVVADTNWLDPGFAQTDDHPVVCVSWNDAVEFCKWSSIQERKTYRLLTEAEWEYCCRAGSKGRWSFSDNEDELWDYARVGGNSQNHAWPVAGLKENAWGLYDMHGNVSEWCQDMHDRNYYTISPSKDPPGPDARETRVIRGGAYFVHEACCSRSAMRHYFSPATSANFVGFRVAQVVSPSE